MDERFERYDREAAERLRHRLAEGVLLAQGPMGSVLQGEPGSADIPSALWNVAEPQTVSRHHLLYATAGAEVLITNSFQANALSLQRDRIDRRVGEMNRAAVDCARVRGVELLLGSVGPCGLASSLHGSPEFEQSCAAYRQQAYALLDAGVSGILLETFTSLAELDPALAGVFDVADGMPVLASVVIDEEGRLLKDGLPIESVLSYLQERGVDAAGVNCCSLSAAACAVPRMVEATSLPLMVRPNGGAPIGYEDGAVQWGEHPDAFVQACDAWVKQGVRLVAGCCGTSARTTCALAGLLDKL